MKANALRFTSSDRRSYFRAALNINEAASALGCSRTHIYNEIRSGHLLARRSRGRTIILPDDLSAYLQSLPTTMQERA